MPNQAPHVADRVEVFISSIDAYEPQLLAQHEDAFRIFARYVSRSLDGRYLERHPPAELLPDLENIMQQAWQMSDDKIIVRCMMSESAAGKRGAILTCMPDQHFIYSILRLTLENLGLKTYRLINSVIPVARDPQGNLLSVGTLEAARESFIWMEVDAEMLAENSQKIERLLLGRLAAARSVVEDFEPLTNLVRSLAQNFEILAQEHTEERAMLTDNARLLTWLLSEHFVFLGTRYLPFSQNKSDLKLENYGIGRIFAWNGMQLDNPGHMLQEMHGKAPYLWINKSRTEAWIYRSGRNDQVLVQHFDDQGLPCGLVVIEGLFSYPALSEPRTSVPQLDRTIDLLFAQLQATKGSHRYRTIRNAFNSLPLEYLFALPPDDIRRLIEQVLEVDVQNRLQVHITTDEDDGNVFIFVALPRSHFSEECRHDIRELLKKRFNASAVDDGVYAGNYESVIFHFFLTGAQKLLLSQQQELKNDIEQLANPWSERLADELQRRYPGHEARRLHSLYHEAFSHRYREETSVARAVADITILETIHTNHPFDCDVYQESSEEQLNITRLRMFQTEPLMLSAILPILDNFGLMVIDQFPTSVHIPGRPEYSVATFRLKGAISSRRIRLRNAVIAVVTGAMANEPVNRLLLRADIPWPSVVLIHAYHTYALQLGLPYEGLTVLEALLQHAGIVRALTELFRVKFDPEIEGIVVKEIDDRRLQLVERTRRALLLQLESVDDLTSDQILRTLYNLLEATVRTNFYARKIEECSHVVLKFDPSQIARMPEPRPFREIFVFHPEVSGLHLRGGPIARGGIRWSDRLLDFRTEVLGLMVTQNLKNVLIVPRGAKGAFVLRQPNSDFMARRAQADNAYRIFIGGLLEVTDNLIEGILKKPEAVLCYEESDHYLVVAADKGTAHLSDTANALARNVKFWLGDAFASGGSHGYDHKKEAITSRGAWACVRRHFREIGQDPEVDKIRVVGIGDMSGDVFGNGMLRSQTIQLIAAFDHRHIFIDPNPDVELSYLARKQLFEVPRSSWNDYPSDKLSTGGGIYPRGAKSIVLSPAAKIALDLPPEDAPLSGPELVRAILRAPVDLLWNGGIGTYIKAVEESDLEVGDHANDHVRVNGKEVRAKVIGEGGNLGVTQGGRIELANNSIRLNTDAVDNSAGVDLSDHEVNLKILFQHHKERHGFPDSERDILMEELREEIAHIVVGNNWHQSRMISLDVIRSQRELPRFMRAATFLATRTPFVYDKALLPSERVAKLRIQKNIGLMRPELAFLAAHAKLDLRQELTREQEKFSTEKLHDYLMGYFPVSLHQRFTDSIINHPLALNIARTVLTNWLIADAGISFLPEISLLTGCDTGDIINQYMNANTLINARGLKGAIFRLESQLNTATEYALRLLIEDALEKVCVWLLMQTNLQLTQFKATFQEIFTTDLGGKTLSENMPHLDLEPLSAELMAALNTLQRIDALLDIALLSIRQQIPVQQAAHLWLTVGEQSQLTHAIGLALESPGLTTVDELDRPARLSLQNRLREILLQVCAKIAENTSNLAQPIVLSNDNDNFLKIIANTLTDLEMAERPLCNLVIATDRILRLVGTLS